MRLLGLDIADRRVIGVVVDGDGAVVRRARADGTGPLAADVAAELVAGLTIDAFGVSIEKASGNATLSPVKGAPQAVSCTPGVAAISAEVWIGAARGARHA